MCTRSCSPEGIRTPDLFLEREGTKKSDLATKTLTIDAPDRPKRASEKSPSEPRQAQAADVASGSLARLDCSRRCSER